MAAWPFSKKNAEHPADEPSTQAVEDTAAAPQVAEPEAAPGITVVEHDPVNGKYGPFDGDVVNFSDYNFQDFSVGILDLGSLKIPLPHGSQVQVEMGPEGPKMLHIVTEHGRMTPVAFAAPRQSGQWAIAAADLIKGIEGDGLSTSLEEGPWGTEVVGTNVNGTIRVIGIEGPRWLFRLTLAAPAGKEHELAQLGREVAARSFVYRGSDPILAGSSLPVTMPQPLVEQVRQAMEQREQAAESAAAAPASAHASEQQAQDIMNRVLAASEEELDK